MKANQEENYKIHITSKAAQRILEIVKSSPHKKGLRITIEGGGCSGFSYKFDFASTKETDDTILEKDGAYLFIDSLSLSYMKGSTLDFVDDLMGKSFRIHNPQAVSSCGCGTSFSL